MVNTRRSAPTDLDSRRWYGAGISNRAGGWRLTRSSLAAPLWTKDPVPARTTTTNFTAHAGAGLRIFIRPHDAFIISYRLHHISNGNRLERNPGVNAHVLQFGWSYLRPHR